jgi:outer membrane protein TolC
MRGVVVALGLLVLCMQAGCHRAFYRTDADRETYQAVHQRMNDPRWLAPRASIDPPPASRLHDSFDPDRPPLPPDDPAAHQHMLDAQNPCLRWLGVKCPNWEKDGVIPHVEDCAWKAHLPLEPDGTLLLTQDRVVELGLLHSREYQTAMEDLYLRALTLTLNRFEFDIQWFLRNNTFYDHFGSSSVPTESNTLSTNTNLGLNRAFASGGQLLVEFANSWVWEYTSKDTNTVSSNILISLIQPLLRQAGRRVRLEGLTQAERNLLYQVRDFARFRKQFSVNLTTGTGYLALLRQLQDIRNLQANLESLEQNLRLHEAQLPLGAVSLLQVDQAFQSYQQGRFQLLRAQTALETALDSYKITLGLPPSLPVRLDDSPLDIFQLADLELVKVQAELEQVHAEYRKLDVAPTVDKLRSGYRALSGLETRLAGVLGQVEGEIKRWGELPVEADAPNRGREKEFREALARRLAVLRTELEELRKGIATDSANVQEARRADSWLELQVRVRQLIGLAAQMFVVQNQVRVYLIRLDNVDLEPEAAIQYALSQRLDLMNQRAQVVDAWRRIHIAANALQADVDVNVQANIRTEADASNPFDFSASNSSYRAGVELDGPLNRKAERNTYRETLVRYQRARRDFMAREDAVSQQIRRDLRELQNERVNFEIARQSLISAARQVEAARERLLLAQAADTTITRDLLDALNQLLQAKSALIGSWVNHQTLRTQLLLDLEALQVDDRGLYRNDQELPVSRGDRTGRTGRTGRTVPRDGPGGP